MTTKELIRREIERRIEWLNTVTNDFREGRRAELRSLYDFLDTLPDESERPTMGYDEAYLNEKIAKASKSWEGVDVDKFMDEIRGREPVVDCNDLEKEYKEYVDNNPVFSKLVNRNAGISIARHFAELMKKRMPLPEDTVIFQKGVEEGKRLMMEGAFVDNYVVDDGRIELDGTPLPCLNPIILLPYQQFQPGDKVKIIIVKED